MSGVLVVEQAHTQRTSEQVACWYTEVELEPGEYPIEQTAQHGFQSRRWALIPGTITDENFPSLFGGVAFSPGRKDNIGKNTTYRMYLPDSCDEPDSDYGTYGRDNFNRHLAGKARIELR